MCATIAVHVADYAAYELDMQESYPFGDDAMPEPTKPTPVLMTLSFADCQRYRGVEVAIVAHPAARQSLLWQSESHRTKHNEQTCDDIRDWGRNHFRGVPILDIDTGKVAEAEDFEWDALWERGEFSEWSPRSAIAFHLPTLAECLSDVSLADEIFGRAMWCPWDGIETAAWDALRAEFEAELAKPVDR